MVSFILKNLSMTYSYSTSSRQKNYEVYTKTECDVLVQNYMYGELF